MVKQFKISKITKDTLGYLLAKMPNKDEWKKYYVKYQNC